MKIIHTADIHLASKMEKFPAKLAEQRRAELRNTLARLAQYAEDNGIAVIILAGDVFDADTPLKKDKEFFYSVVANHPGVDFLYLRGNHDRGAGYEGQGLANLKTFGTSWTKYSYGDVDIYGIEMTNENALSLYSTLITDPNRCNIVMLHGQISDKAGRDLICLPKLRNRNIDYLALGHIHKTSYAQIDDRGYYVYPGCLEGRGFDEPGPHGFFLLSAGEGTVKVSAKGIGFAERQILIQSVDISGYRDAYSIAQVIKGSMRLDKRNIYRIILTGETDFDTEFLAADVQKYLSGEVFYIEVKDQTRRKIDIHAYDKDVSLRGEFVRYVAENKDYTDEEKQLIIHCGLKVLNGEDCDL